MLHLTVPLSEQLLLSMNMNGDEIVSSMRKNYALKLYGEGNLTLNQSAELSGMNLYDFMALLSSSGIPVIDYAAEELKTELAQF
jgi:predicted HTH domain antitoxin